MAEPKRQSTAKNKRAALTGREYARNKRIAFWMLVFLVVVAAFAGGFLLRSNIPLMVSLGVPVDESVEAPASNATAKPKTVYDALSARISEVEDMLTAYSFDEIHLEEATAGTLTDLMASTQDPYAAYLSQERYEAYMKETSERGQSGIGVLFGDYDGRAYVIDVLEGSQAQAEGVRQGDFVHAVDGDASHTWSTSELVGALARQDGENVVITWVRPISLDATTGEEFTTTLACRTYDVVNVTYELREQVGYIKLHQITGNCSALVQDAVEQLAAQGAQAYVLDVTDNPGGYLTQALDVASLFIPSGVLVGIETPEGTSTRTATGATITMAPMVVMANEFTSGVTEVLVAALKDNQRATVVGQTTIGKGSVQVTRELSFGGAIRYTAAYYLTPSGREISGNGVAPDIEVANPQDDTDDRQLLVAVETARSMIGA